MCSVLTIINWLLQAYIWVMIAYVVMGLLIAFGVVNPYNRAVNMIYEFLYRITEPVLQPIRRILPDTRPLDLSPLVLLLGIWLIQLLMFEYLYPLFECGVLRAA